MVEIGTARDPDAGAKQLFKKLDVETQTDLSAEQAEAIAKIKLLAFAFHNPALARHLQDYMELLKSKDRKSLGEYVDALKSKTQQLADKAGKIAMFG
jgi:hypothetical protein